jgi:hypothetical protein
LVAEALTGPPRNTAVPAGRLGPAEHRRQRSHVAR